MDQVLNDYLTKMEKYLKVLPASERIDIVNELKSEMVELTNQGTSSEEILNRLGKPKLLARAYLADEISKIVLFLIGWGFWKLTLLFIKSVGKYNKLKNKTK